MSIRKKEKEQLFLLPFPKNLRKWCDERLRFVASPGLCFTN
jgi:hypothetical protein